MVLAGLKRVLKHHPAVVAAAVVVAVAVRHGRAHCTRPRDVLMEDKPRQRDVCNSTRVKKKKKKAAVNLSIPGLYMKSMSMHNNNEPQKSENNTRR